MGKKLAALIVKKKVMKLAEWKGMMKAGNLELNLAKLLV